MMHLICALYYFVPSFILSFLFYLPCVFISIHFNSCFSTKSLHNACLCAIQIYFIVNFIVIIIIIPIVQPSEVYFEYCRQFVFKSLHNFTKKQRRVWTNATHDAMMLWCGLPIWSKLLWRSCVDFMNSNLSPPLLKANYCQS